MVSEEAERGQAREVRLRAGVLVAAYCAGVDGASGAELPHRGRFLGLHQPAPEARQPRHQRGQGRLARGENARGAAR